MQLLMACDSHRLHRAILFRVGPVCAADMRMHADAPTGKVYTAKAVPHLMLARKARWVHKLQAALPLWQWRWRWHVGLGIIHQVQAALCRRLRIGSTRPCHPARTNSIHASLARAHRDWMLARGTHAQQKYKCSVQGPLQIWLACCLQQLIWMMSEQQWSHSTCVAWWHASSC